MGWRRFCQSVSGYSRGLPAGSSPTRAVRVPVRRERRVRNPVTFAVERFERGKFHGLARVRRKANYGRSRRI